MAFEAEHRNERWVVGEGPILFGPYDTQEKAEESALVVNRTSNGSARSADAVRAEFLLKSDCTDEEVERLTGVALADILFLRAKLATDGEQTLQGGRRAKRPA